MNLGPEVKHVSHPTCMLAGWPWASVRLDRPGSIRVHGEWPRLSRRHLEKSSERALSGSHRAERLGESLSLRGCEPSAGMVAGES